MNVCTFIINQQHKIILIGWLHHQSNSSYVVDVFKYMKSRLQQFYQQANITLYFEHPHWLHPPQPSDDINFSDIRIIVRPPTYVPTAHKMKIKHWQIYRSPPKKDVYEFINSILYPDANYITYLPFKNILNLLFDDLEQMMSLLKTKQESPFFYRDIYVNMLRFMKPNILTSIIKNRIHMSTLERLRVSLFEDLLRKLYSYMIYYWYDPEIQDLEIPLEFMISLNDIFLSIQLYQNTLSTTPQISIVFYGNKHIDNLISVFKKMTSDYTCSELVPPSSYSYVQSPPRSPLFPPNWPPKQTRLRRSYSKRSKPSKKIHSV
jgi:hypothetical protein